LILNTFFLKFLFCCFDWNISSAARINLALRFGAPEKMEVELTRKSSDVSLNLPGHS